MKFFSDEFAANNEQYARQLGLWAFQRAGVLRLSNDAHFLTESEETLEQYTIFNQVTFRVDIHEIDESGNWVEAGNTDIQVEWTRMDPFVRQYLTKTAGSAEQKFDFKVPHVYGVYKFIINYKRVGYTFIQYEQTVPVIPLQHTEYERFIVSAYPYYASAGSMVVGLFLFSFVFLYHK
jgi:oligosaccharyltransferase complex subunit beta